MRRVLLSIAALGLSVSCQASDHLTAQSAGAAEPQIQAFAGQYEGTYFDAAITLDLRSDGTFSWLLDEPRRLDYRAEGIWTLQDNVVAFTSRPVPVEPELVWAGTTAMPDGPMVRVFDEDGKPVRLSSSMTKCADGQSFLGRIGPQGGRPNPEQCPQPVSIRIQIPHAEVDSPIYNLAEMGWKPGMMIRFEFRPNDLGVVDFTGTTGTIKDGLLQIASPLGDQELRKIEHSIGE